VIRYLLFITVYHRLFVLWLIVAYSGLSRHALLLDTRQSISGKLFRVNISTICWRSKKQKSVATSTCEAEYMALALATKQWIWSTNALEELNVPATNAAMFCDNKAAIDIAYNPKIGDRSKHIAIAYHLVRENVESGSISLQVESAENLADSCTKGLPQVTLWKLRTAIMDAQLGGMLHFGGYCLTLLFIADSHLPFIISSSFKQRTFLI
jgi:hypothetical protein